MDLSEKLKGLMPPQLTPRQIVAKDIFCSLINDREVSQFADPYQQLIEFSYELADKFLQYGDTQEKR